MKLSISCIRISTGQVTDQKFVDEFVRLFRGEITNVSPEAWFADVTIVPDDRTFAMICHSCWERPGFIPIIDEHPKFGRVFHSLMTPGGMFKKAIAAEFKSPARRGAANKDINS